MSLRCQSRRLNNWQPCCFTLASESKQLYWGKWLNGFAFLFSFKRYNMACWLNALHSEKSDAKKIQSSASLCEVNEFQSWNRKLQNPKSRLVHDPSCAILTTFGSSDSPAMEALGLLMPQLRAQRITRNSQVFEEQCPHVGLRSSPGPLSWSQGQRLSPDCDTSNLFLPP